MEDNIVIVLDNSNYKGDYAELPPFKAKVIDKYEREIMVKSLSTRKTYTLYYYQILEFLPIKEIRQLIDLNKYGE